MRRNVPEDDDTQFGESTATVEVDCYAPKIRKTASAGGPAAL